MLVINKNSDENIENDVNVTFLDFSKSSCILYFHLKIQKMKHMLLIKYFKYFKKPVT